MPHERSRKGSETSHPIHQSCLDLVSNEKMNSW